MEIFFTLLNTVYVREQITERTMDKLKNDAQIIGEVLKIQKSKNYHDILKILDTRYTILSMNGTVIYDSKNYENETNMDNHLYRPEIDALKNEKQAFDIRNSRTLNEKMAYYAITIEDYSGDRIIIRTSESFKSQQQEINTLFLLQVFFFIILDLTILIFYRNYIKRSKRKRIERMREFLEKGITMEDEYLSDDKWLLKFWFVVREWQEKNLLNIKKLNQEKILLNRLINSLDEGILLFDENLDLITKNSSMNFLFHKDSKKYLEVINNIEIIDVLKECYQSKKDISREIYISSLNLYLFTDAKYLPDNEQYILTLKNISQEKEIINIQRKFISNVSHELKTPLTNIKGYLIALEDAPEELKVNFLNIIKSNVNKLENIVTDFLTISKLESKIRVNPSKFTSESLLKELETSISEMAKKKNGKVVYEIEENLIQMVTDFDKLLMTLKNLLENGFIYNSSKNPQVKLTLHEKNEWDHFSVKDNGIGISRDKLNNIFDRFYRVDEARTSNIAGTGLGLAIVKECVKTLGGDIQVISQPNEGTEFIFRIKKLTI
ncbi:MAG: sensor histidine kinase [Fusobacteriaceae bacterium]